MSFEEVLRGSQLVTVEVLYQVPDYPSLVQEFTWQTFDISPKYPRLHRFLDFWDQHIHGKRLSTRVQVRGIIAPTDWVNIEAIYRLN